MTASILAQAGLRAGLFTSPHLYRFHERMQVNGAPIPDEVLGRLTQQVLEVAEGMSDPPTEFELMTAVGMEFFWRSSVTSWCWRWVWAAAWTPPT